VNKLILQNKVQDFINNHLNSDLSKLIFKGSPFADLSIQELAEQIEAKKRAKDKLPTWFSTDDIYYPNKLSIEQSSSEITAQYKAKLVSGNSLMDLTGGMGIDTYYFSKHVDHLIHCEINEQLSELVKHNFKLLKADNIKPFPTNGITYLQNQQEHYDWIFVDPSRRNDTKGKVFLLEDCLPDIPKYLDLMFDRSDHILIKASPMLDITKAVNELNYVKEIHVVAVKNEVKELLFILEKSFKSKIMIKAVNIKKEGEIYFESAFKKSSTSDLALPQVYLYEPNAALLKAGLHNEVSNQLKVYKLHNNSHLYTSNNLIIFPGRRFEIIQILSYNLKDLKKALTGYKANITVRNFPETVSDIRKKTKIKEGGKQYLFFTTDRDNKHIIIFCKKV
jgi:hypothetical protein